MCLTVRKNDHGIMYKGIPGTVFCAGSDCAVVMCSTTSDAAVDVVSRVKKLTGSWYFTPEQRRWSGTSGQHALTGVTTYSPETLYAQFGHWLVDTKMTDTAQGQHLRVGRCGGGTNYQYDGRLNREHWGWRHHTVGYVGQLPRACRRHVRPPDRQHGRHDQHDPIGCVYRHGQLGGDIRR